MLEPKYNSEESEQKWREYWEKEKTYQFQYDEKLPLYAVDTPPPYVSADHLHTGHIMSYAQAEFIVRYKRMNGFNVFYPMGFDDNGLPTERFVEKKYKIDKSTITRSEFIKLCLKETEVGSQTYKKLWNDLGISVDWSKTYSTISPLAVKVSQWSLIDLYKKGALCRSENPILWCPTCQTAIAQADLEDKEFASKMNYINFKSAEGVDLTIATTRPELIPACVALYVNPNDSRFKNLIGKEATVPLFNYNVPIKTSEKVSMETGTGLMMVCTWGDQEDLEKWRTDKLESRALVTEDGKLNELGGAYAGLTLEKAREQIINDLKTAGLLIKQDDITHFTNVHERCSTAIEFVLSKQWFIKIVNLKDKFLEMGRKINWYPENKINDYELWVNSLKWDWCISRQRYYGVPLPIWYCQKCETPIFADENTLPINPTESNPPVDKCPNCGHTEFRPETDVMDTWGTSSCTPFLIRELATEKGAKEKLFPVTLRPNAFEIIRTWDFYSIVKSYYHFNEPPFKDVMISGHGLDEQGKKISKRLGNYIPSEELMKQYGADPIRYWATGATLGQNLRFNVSEVEKGKKTVVKLWNVARFSSMNVAESNDEKYVFEPADLWIADELNKTIKKATDGFENYTYAQARDAADEFFWSKLADYYLEFIKYRLFGEDLASKKAAQYTLAQVFLKLLKLYAPLLPFITEEIYQALFAAKDGAKSIHLSTWPQSLKLESDLDVSDFPSAIAAIDEIRKFKSEQNISLGKELEEYELKTKVDLVKYGEFIKKAIRVKNIK